MRRGALAGLGVADVDVHDRGAGLGGVDRRVGDLLGRDGHVRALAGGVARAGDRAGDEDVPVHRWPLVVVDSCVLLRDVRSTVV